MEKNSSVTFETIQHEQRTAYNVITPAGENIGLVYRTAGKSREWTYVTAKHKGYRGGIAVTRTLATEAIVTLCAAYDAKARAEVKPVISTMTWIPAKPGERSTTPAALSYDGPVNCSDASTVWSYRRDCSCRRCTKAHAERGMVTGYVHCACRDCMEVAIGPVGTMCSDCADAGCDAFYTECRRCDVEMEAETSTITAPREPTAGMTARAPRGTTYAITNTEGRQGRAWDARYATQQDAAAALMRELGWSTIVLSDSYTADEGAAVSAYETQAECDADGEGAYAPRIIAMKAPACDCGEWSGVPCDGPQQTTVEWMPPHLRESHRAAGGHGRYPSNGALRLRVSNTCAESMEETDGDWTVRLETPDANGEGLTLAEWLAAAGRSDTASEYDLRAAWRAGEDPTEYRTPMQVQS